MTDIGDSLVLRAFAALGHHLKVETWTEEQRHLQIVQTAYWPRADPQGPYWVTVSTSLEAFIRAYQPEDLIADAVAQAIEQLVADPIRRDVARVTQAMRHGPLGIELVGGARDGEHVDGLARDGNGWPVPVLYLPVPTGSLPTYRESMAPDPTAMDALYRVATYQREYVSPATLHWRYLAKKDA